MKFAYADPPYLGCGCLYAKHHPDALEWDSPDRHKRLIELLCNRYPDGWAMSLHVPSMKVILPMLPQAARIGAWVKPFASFKPGVNPAYTWEPIAWVGGRKRERMEPTVRDYVSANITLKKGLTGAKPDLFCSWVLDVLNAKPGDIVVDLFPGTGAFGRAAQARGCVLDFSSA